MPVTVHYEVINLTKAFKKMQRVFEYIVDDGKKDVSLAAFNAAGKVFGENFDRGGIGAGVGGWAPLAKSTQDKRKAEGFQGDKPILIRYRDLRTISADALRVADGSGTFAATDPNGRTVRLSLNISAGNSWATLTGEKVHNQRGTKNMPARPFWFTTKTVQQAMKRRAVDVLSDKIEKI